MTPVSVRQWEDGESWNRYVDGSESATAYQRFEWGDLYREVFRHPGHYLGAVRGEALTGILP
jgi:hypothetical protein